MELNPELMSFMEPNYHDCVDDTKFLQTLDQEAKKRNMQVRSYRIKGIVQGVGFRPFIHKLAKKYKSCGWILNDSQGVLLELEGKSKSLDGLINEIRESTPPMAQIDDIYELPCATQPGTYNLFKIKKSEKGEKTETLVAPDSFVCNACKEELFNKNDRRYRYPFINCTDCGPRYSIIYDMPYDRKNTTMRPFNMCEPCLKEYTDIEDRRYHAQPNACPECGPQLSLVDNRGQPIITSDIIEFCRRELLQGKIVAVKSLAGFHIACDALNKQAVKELRKRKKRDLRPFAVMVKDIEIAKRNIKLSETDIKLMQSVARPIVLAEKRFDCEIVDVIAPKNPNFGIMLPSTPLHYLLLEKNELTSLVMTSGNVSGQPIVYKNEDAVKMLSKIADYIILHNRDIHIRVDDSIVRSMKHPVTKKLFSYFIRRSKGYAPYPIRVNTNLKSIVAYGAELKTTGAISKNDKVFISQHIGDLKNDTMFQAHLDCSNHLQRLLSISPQIIACDLHPSFRATHKALEKNMPVTQVQHHHAHMASCMADNGLDSRVIGVIFDGVGYGTDGNLWGGEFLVGDYSTFQRAAHLRPFYLLGGDKAVLEPFRVAIDLLFESFGDDCINLPIKLFENHSTFDLNVYLRMAHKKINSFATTSMGRLFDGISSLLDVCNKIEYEAQAAIELESLLDRDMTLSDPFPYELINQSTSINIDYRPMIKAIINKLLTQGYDSKSLSRKFHSTIVDIIKKVSLILKDKYSTNKVVLSGGVFLNEFLLINAIKTLSDHNMDVYFHSKVPTNDGGISFGQIMVANAQNQKINDNSLSTE